MMTDRSSDSIDPPRPPSLPPPPSPASPSILTSRSPPSASPPPSPHSTPPSPSPSALPDPPSLNPPLEATEYEGEEDSVTGPSDSESSSVSPSAEEPDITTEMLRAARSEDNEKVTRLLQQGADPLARNNYDDTGLHISAKKGIDIMAKIFLENGCDINSRGQGQWTPLINSSYTLVT